MWAKLKKYALPVGLSALGLASLGITLLPANISKWVTGLGLLVGGIAMLAK